MGAVYVPSSSLYKFVFDDVNSLFKVYSDDVFLVDVPFQTEGDPKFYIDDNFSVDEASENAFTLIYKSSDYTTISDFKFDFSGIFNTLSSGVSFDFGVWGSSYNLKLLWFAVDVNGNFNNLVSDYFNIDTVSYTAVGLTYDDGSGSTTCDLTSLTPEFDEIDLSIASLDDKVDNLHQKVDYLVTLLGQVHTLEQTLATKTDIQNLSNDIENIVLPSLNGNGTEFKDGVQVTIFGRETVYTVERSYMSLYSDNGYTVHYDLVSSDGYKCSVPEALLTKYVEAV